MKQDELKEKVDYCLKCKTKPCSVKGCPLNNNIPEFIEQIKKGNLNEAYNILCDTTVMQAICGRICPHEKGCQGSCTRGIKGDAVSIGELEAYVGDFAIQNNLKIKKEPLKSLLNKKVAIVGGGPSGLTCAAFLAKRGIDVTIYERYNFLGGLLMYGIPEFRLPKTIVKDTIQKILDLGVKVKFNQKLGNNLKLEDLTKNYDAIYLAFGGNVSCTMAIEGENLQGVYGANELLEYEKYPDFNGKDVIINGGGNVAIDIARVIKRKNASTVTIVYRRDKKEMPAEEKEVEDAKKEGIQFLFKNNIVKINGKEKVESVELIKTELVQKLGEKRLSPQNIDGTNYTIKTDYIIMALGSKTDEFVKELGLDITQNGYIKVDENFKTSNPKIFAGGDLIGKTKTVAQSSRNGRDVAEQIIKEFFNK